MFSSFVLWGLVCTMSWAFIPGIIALASPKGADGAFATYLTLNIGIKLISIEPSRRRSFNYLAFGAWEEGSLWGYLDILISIVGLPGGRIVLQTSGRERTIPPYLSLGV